MAIDVPECKANPPSMKGSKGELAANTLTLGAAISGCVNMDLQELI